MQGTLQRAVQSDSGDDRAGSHRSRPRWSDHDRRPEDELAVDRVGHAGDHYSNAGRRRAAARLATDGGSRSGCKGDSYRRALARDTGERGGSMMRATIAVLLVTFSMMPAMTGQQSEVPAFKVDPGWAKIPNNWQFGQVASVAIDAQDHVWVLQRPGTLAPEEKPRAAPPLLEFDAAGNFIQAWGGPGAGYEWPNSEHGVYVDPKGFVWIGGNGDNDHQILKFTKTGKFVMQIGRAGKSTGNADTRNLNQPADTFVYAKTNELFVADGYGNRRVIVFDADTGAFKRMWGAFGNVPSDGAPDLAQADIGADGPPQFVQPVHAARVSNDGFRSE